jgi:hypothetical protein
MRAARSPDRTQTTAGATSHRRPDRTYSTPSWCEPDRRPSARPIRRSAFMPDPPRRTERRDRMTARASSGTQRCASGACRWSSDGVQIDRSGVGFRLPPQALLLTHRGGNGASSDRHPAPDDGVILIRRSRPAVPMLPPSIKRSILNLPSAVTEGNAPVRSPDGEQLGVARSATCHRWAASRCVSGGRRR